MLKLGDFCRLAKRIPVFRNEENIGPGASRNKVCKWITEKGLRSKYLYHSDNDVYFKKDWLKTIILAMQTIGQQMKVLGGGCHP